MSNLENDKIYEGAYEDFFYLYFNSDAFASQVHKLLPEYCDEYTRGGTAIRIIFDALWHYDAEGAVRDPQSTLKSLIAHLDRMYSFLKVAKQDS